MLNTIILEKIGSMDEQEIIEALDEIKTLKDISLEEAVTLYQIIESYFEADNEEIVSKTVDVVNYLSTLHPELKNSVKIVLPSNGMANKSSPVPIRDSASSANNLNKGFILNFLDFFSSTRSSSLFFYSVIGLLLLCFSGVLFYAKKQSNTQVASPVPLKSKTVVISLEASDVFFEKSDSGKIEVEKELNMNQVSYSENMSDDGLKIVSEVKNSIAYNSGYIKVKLPDNCIITFKSMSGSVHINGIDCVSIMVETMSGDIAVDSLLTQNETLETMSGSILYKGKVTDGKHVLSSVSGSVVISLDPSSDVSIDLYSKKSYVAFGQEQHMQSYKQVLNSGSATIVAKSHSGFVKCFVQ